MTVGRFTADTIATLGKRAALLCSNPDCGALTAGPTADVDGAVVIGEAAHIFGLTSGSARFNEKLSSTELADITNGIWLCRNCHKTADNDPCRFPAELLFQWRRMHETAILLRLGKAGDRLREKLREDQLKPFSDTSYLAQQIILDRPPYWEYKLAAELLRTGLGAVHARWQQLKRGMYFRKSAIISSDTFFEWFSARNKDLSRYIGSLLPQLEALTNSFGPPGTAGDEKDILTSCRLIVATAQNLLEWEEDIRFVHVAEEYEDVIGAWHGVSGHQLDEIFRLPSELSQLMSNEGLTGTHVINLVMAMPDGFSEKMEAAFEAATARIRNRW